MRASPEGNFDRDHQAAIKRYIDRHDNDSERLAETEPAETNIEELHLMDRPVHCRLKSRIIYLRGLLRAHPKSSY